MNFRALENQSESLKSPGNIVSEKGYEPCIICYCYYLLLLLLLLYFAHVSKKILKKKIATIALNLLWIVFKNF